MIGFTLIGVWEQCKLGDLGSVAMNKRIFKEQTSESGDIPFYKIGTFGATADAFISRELFETYKKKYPYPKIGDLLISASGSIGRVVEYKGNDEYFQDSNIVWLKHDDRINNLFLKQFYSIVKWHGLEGSTIKRLYNKNILETTIHLPVFDEQEKIGTLFKQLDDIITLHQRKLEQLKELKKAYLQLMFPKKDETLPRVRFADFEGEWEQCKLKNLFLKGGSGGTPTSSNSDYYNGDIPFLSISDITKSNGYIYTTEKCISLERLKNSSAWIVPKESISLAMYASVGKVAILKLDIATSQAFYNMIFEDINTRNYIYHYLIKKEVFNEWITLISTGTQANLNADKVKNTFVLIPSNNEQKKIAELLRCIEVSIDIQQKKIHILKSLKKSYLQNMFI
ncbi:restriction endonuclease subunit S [Enterococcus faecalis]|uniref:restriction endonuclease subunit S n=2 Tax=Enterococcus faecalis TaxID=1351 RepID=UPI00391B7D11